MQKKRVLRPWGRSLMKEEISTPATLRPGLGPIFDRRFTSYDKLPAVSGDVVVYTAFQSVEQGGLAMEAAAHDQGDTGRNTQALGAAGVGQIELHLQGSGTLRGTTGGSHRGRSSTPRAPRQNTVPCHKGNQVAGRKLGAQEVGVFACGYVFALRSP